VGCRVQGVAVVRLLASEDPAGAAEDARGPRYSQLKRYCLCGESLLVLIEAKTPAPLGTERESFFLTTYWSESTLSSR